MISPEWVSAGVAVAGIALTGMGIYVKTSVHAFKAEVVTKADHAEIHKSDLNWTTMQPRCDHEHAALRREVAVKFEALDDQIEEIRQVIREEIRAGLSELRHELMKRG